MAKLVSSTYGESLFEVAVEQNMTDALYDEAVCVLQVFSENKELSEFLCHPNIEKDEKIKVMINSFEKFVSKEMTGFLVTVVEKDRAYAIKDILNYFLNKVKEYKGIGTAYVTTPVEPDKAAKEKILKRLLETTDYQEFEIHYSVDESLIGGMIIRVGDRVVDSSIKHKLLELSRQLQKIDL